MRSEQSRFAREAFGPNAATLVTVKYKSHVNTLRALRKVLNEGRTFGLLSGPRSSGKTVTVKRLADILQDETLVVTIDGAGQTPRQFASTLLAALDFDVALQSTVELLDLIHVIALHRARTHSAPVLIVENIDRMAPSTLHLLCTLAEFTTRGRSAIRIIMTGGSRCRTVLDSQEMVSVARRTQCALELGAMSRRETAIYLHARLLASGAKDPDGIFPIDVCDRLHEQSGGWPGTLNEYAMQAIERTSVFPVRVSDTYKRSELRIARPTVVDPLPVLTPESAPTARLIVSRLGATVGEYTLDDAKLLIGRSHLADVKINDDFASKCHAILVPHRDGFMIIDLKSSNGTLVNSRKIKSKALTSNDIISIGHHRIKVENISAVREVPDTQGEHLDTVRMKTLADRRKERQPRHHSQDQDRATTTTR